MTDMTNYIHMGITLLTSIVVAIGAYLKMRESKISKDAKDEQVCHQEFQELQTKVAVLEERINNEIIMLSKLDDKLDQIRDRL